MSGSGEHQELRIDTSSEDNLSERDENYGSVYPIYFVRRNSKRKFSGQDSHRRIRKMHRFVAKSGESLVFRKKFTARQLFRYFLDLSNTLISSHWKWTLVTLAAAFVGSWLVFAWLWWLISFDNDEIDENDDLVKNITALANDTACIKGIKSFTGYLLFSIETQSSIGYGNRYINQPCTGAVMLICVQIMCGVCVCGYLGCIVYLKMIRPERLHAFNCFSKFATICQRNGRLYFVFRVRDCRSRRYECQTKLSAYLVNKKDEEVHLRSVRLTAPGILIWPIEVVHEINETSPLWDLSAKDLIIKRYEIIVIMEGISLTTSLYSRTTTSYLSGEILWGHKFVPCLTYDKEHHSYFINHKLFNATEEILTPLCSAKRLQEVYKQISASTTSTSTPLPRNSSCCCSSTTNNNNSSSSSPPLSIMTNATTTTTSCLYCLGETSSSTATGTNNSPINGVGKVKTTTDNGNCEADDNDGGGCSTLAVADVHKEAEQHCNNFNSKNSPKCYIETDF